jgi:23S rRNA pseudouridine955/2504/2580 synthase
MAANKSNGPRRPGQVPSKGPVRSERASVKPSGPGAARTSSPRPAAGARPVRTPAERQASVRAAMAREAEVPHASRKGTVRQSDRHDAPVRPARQPRASTFDRAPASRPAPPPRPAPSPRPAPAPPEIESPGVRIVRVDDDRDGQRIDNFLLGQLKGAPRSLVYKLVRSGQVRINGKRAKADSRLAGGDEVRIPPVRLAEPGEVRAPPESMLQRLAASIVFEDRNLLALNKPSGIAVHGGSGVSIGVIEALRALRPEESIELVHRLDRDTSGVLIVARRRAALLELQALLREAEDEEAPNKKYLALLVGKMPSGTMTVEAPLQKSVLQGGERMVRVDPAGKPSVSHFRLIERRGGHSFCEVRIETGRTHQIRVHAAHLGHPVAGDEKYGDREANKRLAEQAGLRRLFLHAASMEFALDDGRTPYLINAPLAPELKAVLDRLV